MARRGYPRSRARRARTWSIRRTRRSGSCRYALHDPEREAAQVQLAILELAKGDAKAVRSYTKAAIRDFRDVIYWAFY